jgi:hypothetical protein
LGLTLLLASDLVPLDRATAPAASAARQSIRFSAQDGDVCAGCAMGVLTALAVLIALPLGFRLLRKHRRPAEPEYLAALSLPTARVVQTPLSTSV